MLTHSHDFKLFIPICKEVKKIYRDHSHHPKISSYHIIIPIYFTKHVKHLIPLYFTLLGKFSNAGFQEFMWYLNSFISFESAWGRVNMFDMLLQQITSFWIYSLCLINLIYLLHIYSTFLSSKQLLPHLHNLSGRAMHIV